MEQKVCSLCEGKIVDGRCRDCGMYYREMEGRYFLNRDRAEREKPAVGRDKGDRRTSATGQRRESRRTSVDTQKKDNWKSAAAEQKQNSWKTSGASQKKKSQLLVGGILSLFVLLPAIAPIFERIRAEAIPETVLRETFYEPEIDTLEEMEIPKIPEFDEILDGDEYVGGIYSNVTRPLSEEGEEFHKVLAAGRYIVGCHIPEGNYRVVGPGVEDSVFYVEDEENSIFQYWSLFSDGEEKTDGYEVTDVRLYEGAVIEFEGRPHLQFYTENGQVSRMKSAQPNPLTEEVEVDGEIQRAGEDFEPGTYDIVVEGDIVHVFINYGEGWEARYMLDGCHVEAPQRFRNLEIPQGTEIHMEPVSGSEWKMVLVPSEEVFTDTE